MFPEEIREYLGVSHGFKLLGERPACLFRLFIEVP
jgi:hypothetical protein